MHTPTGTYKHTYLHSQDNVVGNYKDSILQNSNSNQACSSQKLSDNQDWITNTVIAGK